jgi:hypothetical protein
MSGEPTTAPYLLHYVVLWDRAGSASVSVNFHNHSNKRFTAAITNKVWLGSCQGNLPQFHIFFTTSFFGTGQGQPHFQSIFRIVPTKRFTAAITNMVWLGSCQGNLPQFLSLSCRQKEEDPLSAPHSGPAATYYKLIFCFHHGWVTSVG